MQVHIRYSLQIIRCKLFVWWLIVAFIQTIRRQFIGISCHRVTDNYIGRGIIVRIRYYKIRYSYCNQLDIHWQAFV